MGKISSDFSKLTPSHVSQGWSTHSSWMFLLCQDSGETGSIPAALWSSRYISYTLQGPTFPICKGRNKDSGSFQKNAWGLLMYCIEEQIAPIVYLNDWTVEKKTSKTKMDISNITGQGHWWSSDSPRVVADKDKTSVGPEPVNLAKLSLCCKQPIFRIRSWKAVRNNLMWPHGNQVPKLKCIRGG